MPQHQTRRRSSQNLPESRNSPRQAVAWPRQPPELRAAAEEILREMALVLHATRSVRQAMEAPARRSRTSPIARALA
jgi:hypothetical protein